MGLREVKKELKSFKKDELIEVISEIYKRYTPVKEYLNFFVALDEKEVVDKYKEKIYAGFFNQRGNKFKFKHLRNALASFKRLGTSKTAHADLLLYYVECSINYQRQRGSDYEVRGNYYIYTSDYYEKALGFLIEENYIDIYKDRIKKITRDTKWGFIEDINSNFFKDDELNLL